MEASVVNRWNPSLLTVYTGDHYIYVLILGRKQTGYSFWMKRVIIKWILHKFQDSKQKNNGSYDYITQWAL